MQGGYAPAHILYTIYVYIYIYISVYTYMDTYIYIYHGTQGLMPTFQGAIQALQAMVVKVCLFFRYELLGGSDLQFGARASLLRMQGSPIAPSKLDRSCVIEAISRLLTAINLVDQVWTRIRSLFCRLLATTYAP